MSTKPKLFSVKEMWEIQQGSNMQWGIMSKIQRRLQGRDIILIFRWKAKKLGWKVENHSIILELELISLQSLTRRCSRLRGSRYRKRWIWQQLEVDCSGKSSMMLQRRGKELFSCFNNISRTVPGPGTYFVKSKKD